LPYVDMLLVSRVQVHDVNPRVHMWAA
jgi:hypothetical protein